MINRERWPSGLRRTLGKCVYHYRYRGFESHSLRQIFSQKLGFLAQKKRIEIKQKNRQIYVELYSFFKNRNFLDFIKKFKNAINNFFLKK